MKKLLALLTAGLMLVGCSSNTTAPATTAEGTTEPTADATTTETATGTTMGLGSVTSLSTADATADAEGKVQINTTLAAVVLEGDVIKSVTFDVAQNTAKFDATGLVTTDPETETPSKKQKQDEYGMKSASEIGKEWYEQVEALEAYCAGKTVEEVLSMPTYEKNEEHTTVPESEDLKTSVTIDVGAFLKALEKAQENPVDATGLDKAGFASVTSGSFTDATADKDGKVQYNTTYSFVGLDADGKIVANIMDVAQNSASFDATGVITSDPEAATPTKMEKKEDYGMKSASEIGKEWYEQAQALEAYTIGKTVEEVVAMPTIAKDEEHNAIPDVEDLKTSVTMNVGDFLSAIETAASQAK